MKVHLRYLGNRRIGGIVVAFTDATKKDGYGNFWTAETDFALQRYERRPLYYEHKGAMVEAGHIEAADVRVTVAGLYMECDVLENEAGDACLRLIQDGRGHYSTGVMPGSWIEEKDGWVRLWPVVEVSVTQRPATREGLTRASVVRSFLGVGADDSGDMPLRRGPVMGDEQQSKNGQQEVVVEAGAVDVAALADAVAERLKKAEEPATRSLPVGEVRVPTPEIVVHHPYDDLSLGALALRTRLGMSAGRVRGDDVTKAIRALQVKVEKQKLRDESIDDLMVARGAVRCLDSQFYQDWGKHIRSNEAMTSTYQNYGDELVPTLLNTVVWYHFMLEAKVLNALRRFQMPSNPYDWPLVTGGPTIRKVGEAANLAEFVVSGSVFPASKIGTSKKTFTAGKIGAMVIGSEELFEDSGVAVANVFFEQMVRQMASAIDYVLINGDETASTANISHYGTDPTSTVYDKVLILDGLRHIAIGNSDSLGQTTLTVDSPSALRQLMGARGKLGLDPKQLLLVADPNVYYDYLDLDTLESVSDLPDATLFTGVVEHIKRVPVIVSDELEATNASGQIEDSHDTLLGSYLVLNREGLLVGYRREVTTEMGKVMGVDGWVADISVRLDLQEMETGSVAYGYNVGGSA